MTLPEAALAAASILEGHGVYLDTARRLREAAEREGNVLQGWKLVPVEPTEAMLRAAFAAMNETPSGTWKRMKVEGQTPRRLFDVKMAPRYRAMLDAVPAPSPIPDREARLVEALKRIKWLSSSAKSPVMDAWDAARQWIHDNPDSRASMPRDIMENGISLIWEVADGALRLALQQEGEPS